MSATDPAPALFAVAARPLLCVVLLASIGVLMCALELVVRRLARPRPPAD